MYNTNTRKENTVLWKKTLFVLFAFVVSTAYGLDFEITPPKLYEADTNLWVAPDGSDSAAGTEDAPIATLTKAVEKVSAFRTAEPEKSVCVWFKAGTYPMTETVTIKKLAGTPENPVIFRSAPGAEGRCIFSGEKTVTGWEPLETSTFWKDAPEELKSRIKPESVSKIWTAPYAPFETKTYAPQNYGKRQEFFVNGIPQTLARWPNEGFAVSGQALGETPATSWGPIGTFEGIFEAAADQPSGWNREKGSVLFGYWFWDWSESFELIESIEEPESGPKVFRMAKPYSGYGYKHNLRYYGFNLLCELDAPNEYYIDRDSRQIFWIPADGIDPAQVTTTLNVFENSWMISFDHCSDILLAGLTFEGGFGGAVQASQCDRVILADIESRRFSGDENMLFHGGTGCGVYHSLLETLGGGGVTLSGGDRATLTEAHHYISNCTVRNFSRIHRTYTPAALIHGCGMKVEHCDFSDAPSSAMRLDGNEHYVEYSRFTNIVKESDDQGGIDSWYNPTYRGNVIRYNYWKNIVGGTNCGAAAIRFDDMISGFTVYGNIFIHCGAVYFGAIQIHGGKDNVVDNNVFLDCRAAISFTKWGETYTGAFSNPENKHYGSTKEKCYKQVDIDSPLWRERYPELAHIAEDADVNTAQNNIVVNCETAFLNDGGIQKMENNTVETLENPDETELVSPETLEKYGLRPIPVDQIGVTASGLFSK